MNLLIRRRQEDHAARAQAAVQQLSKDANVVSFQHRTDRMITGMLVRQRAAEGGARVRSALDARKARLAALLELEKTRFEEEIAASFEAPEQVKERLLAHAREIKEQREVARRKLAEELELRRFKASSDALRSRASALLTEKTGLDRVAQLQVRAGATAAPVASARALRPS